MRFKSVLFIYCAWLLVSGIASADSFLSWVVTPTRLKGVQTVTQKKYLEECGACHFAYQPGWLPAQSWEKLLNDKALSDHFGDNAELDKDTLQVIREFAIDNAAGNSHYKIARKVTAATDHGDVPLRITELRFIKRKHRQIPEKMIKGNADVKSLSNCSACHTRADNGLFDKDTVLIPHYPDYLAGECG